MANLRASIRATAAPRSYEGERRPGIEYPWSIAHPRRIEDDTAWKARAHVRRSGLR
jgi:hypothetical protein